jgi:lysophospholipase L1-like esterase
VGLPLHRRLLFASVPTALVVGLGELGARIGPGEACVAVQPSGTEWSGAMQPYPPRLWRLAPSTEVNHQGLFTRTNSAGVRDPLEPGTAKAPGEFRVLLTGDSSIFGWALPDGETYADRLEQILRERMPDRTVNVVSMGVPGYSSEQTVRFMEEVGWAYAPDLLVVSNIFSDANIDIFQDRNALALANLDENPILSLLHRSRLYCSMRMPWVRRQLEQMAGQGNRVLMPGGAVDANRAVELEKIDELIDLSRVPIRHYLENLDTLHEECEERGCTMVLAPLAQEWDTGAWTVPMPRPTPDQVLPWQPYRAAQREWAEDKGVALIPFYEVFANAPKEPRLFIDVMHPGKDGARLMARTVAEWVGSHPEVVPPLQ